MPFGELQIVAGLLEQALVRGGEGRLNVGKRFIDDEIENRLHILDMVVERHGFAAQGRRQAPGAQRREPLAVDERKAAAPIRSGLRRRGSWRGRRFPVVGTLTSYTVSISRERDLTS